MAETSTFLANAAIDQWRLLGLIGRGGYAEVYRAVHAESGQECAVKVLRSERLGDKASLRSFENEQEILASLQIAGVPRFRRAAVVKERPCFLMDLCRGISLHQLIAGGKPFDRIGCWMAVARLMAQVHAAGVVHGDLKPENFLLSPQGRMQLLDFGSARRIRTGGTDFITRALFKPALLATPEFLAPEIVKSQVPTRAGDIYSLGVTAFCLLAGRPPFVGATQEAVLRQSLQCQAPGISSLVPKLPRGLCNVADRCLRRDPKDRFGDAEELWVSLQVHFRQPGVMPPVQLSHHLAGALIPGDDGTGSSEIRWIDE